MAPPKPNANPLKGKKAATAGTVDASNTIRAQSKKDKATAKEDVGDRAGMNRDVLKAVLASPLTVTWPNIPRHLQMTVIHLLREMVPAEVADYHVSRARCHKKERRTKRARLSAKGDTSATAGADELEADGDVEMEDGAAGSKRKRGDEPAAPSSRPLKPEVLSHLVLGINEVVKALEQQTEELRVCLMIMGDVLSGREPAGGLPVKPNHLLPTAPRSPSPAPSEDEEVAPETSSSSSPLAYIVVPLLSINPPSLVSAIPAHCATYNAHVAQFNQLAKVVKSRVKQDLWSSIIGEEREEVRVVPLGAVEKELAEMVGLRRLACLAVRRSHSDIERMRVLLPKSVLHPPRHTITLPIPTSTLTVHSAPRQLKPPPVTNGNPSTHPTALESAPVPANVPIPHVRFAPLHLKGIQTTAPLDNPGRKKLRIEAVRKRREEVRERKKQEKMTGAGKGAKKGVVA
ncbi:hypothetical protein IAT38_003107 [Cryptococcus sp. DSM 104549]